MVLGLLPLETPFGVKIPLPMGHCNVLVLLDGQSWSLGQLLPGTGTRLAPASHTLGSVPASCAAMECPQLSDPLCWNCDIPVWAAWEGWGNLIWKVLGVRVAGKEGV